MTTLRNITPSNVNSEFNEVLKHLGITDIDFNQNQQACYDLTKDTLLELAKKKEVKSYHIESIAKFFSELVIYFQQIGSGDEYEVVKIVNKVVEIPIKCLIHNNLEFEHIVKMAQCNYLPDQAYLDIINGQMNEEVFLRIKNLDKDRSYYIGLVYPSLVGKDGEVRIKINLPPILLSKYYPELASDGRYTLFRAADVYKQYKDIVQLKQLMEKGPDKMLLNNQIEKACIEQILINEGEHVL